MAARCSTAALPRAALSWVNVETETLLSGQKTVSCCLMLKQKMTPIHFFPIYTIPRHRITFVCVPHCGTRWL